MTLRAGPRLLFDDFDLRPELTGRLRELGGDTYSRAFGLGLSSNWVLAPVWRLNASVSAQRISYESFLGEGNIYGAQLGVAHAFGRATLLRGDAGYRREAVEREAYSWREFSVGFLAAREFPKGFVVSAGPSLRWRRYDEPLSIFGSEARSDRTLAGRIKVSNRHIELFGFMPEISLRHERRSSNLDLYNYTRSVVEIGVVRSF